MRSFYQGIDGFVISSHQEGLALVGLEAMAQGVPVVSTRCGGPEEYVLPDETGYLASFDADELAAVILTMLQPQNHARLSANALALVRERYGWQRFRAELLTRFHALFARS
jgi:glycosyltransferase involved in cell wall biosynthesis